MPSSVLGHGGNLTSFCCFDYCKQLHYVVANEHGQMSILRERDQDGEDQQRATDMFDLDVVAFDGLFGF